VLILYENYNLQQKNNSGSLGIALVDARRPITLALKIVSSCIEILKILFIGLHELLYNKVTVTSEGLVKVFVCLNHSNFRGVIRLRALIIHFTAGPFSMELGQIENIEIDLFLDALRHRYGYDFRHYARASVRRRLRYLLSKSKYAHLSELIPILLYDELGARELIYDLSVTVTEMFRDPGFYSLVRRDVVPYLRTYPFFKVWVIGCATGEEVYSLAILLKEEGLLERATIYATDLNEIAIKKAREGIYPIRDVQQYVINYQKSGGKGSLGDYYEVQHEYAIMDKTLKANINFVCHNLTIDRVFNDVHLIFCRNVLIYFDRPLQTWMLSILAESLLHGGFLCLGNKENLNYPNVREQFKAIEKSEHIYQKRMA
jgi:chemotaxis protein methyltransferase CheR